MAISKPGYVGKQVMFNLTLVACYALWITLGKCLQYFNDLCSSDYLYTGQGDFTPATTGEKMSTIPLARRKWAYRLAAYKSLDSFLPFPTSSIQLQSCSS